MGATQSKDDDDSTVNREIFGDLGGEDVKRQTLSRDELMDRLTKMIQACEGCEKVRVIGVTRLDFPDKDGRNWSSSLVLDAAGVAPGICTITYSASIVPAHHSWY